MCHWDQKKKKKKTTTGLKELIQSFQEKKKNV